MIEEIKFEVRCPKCKVVFNDRNETDFKVSNLYILLHSDDLIVFECMRCKHHIPVVFSDAYNIVSKHDSSKYIILNIGG